MRCTGSTRKVGVGTGQGARLAWLVTHPHAQSRCGDRGADGGDGVDDGGDGGVGVDGGDGGVGEVEMLEEEDVNRFDPETRAVARGRA